MTICNTNTKQRESSQKNKRALKIKINQQRPREQIDEVGECEDQNSPRKHNKQTKSDRWSDLW